MVVLQYQSYLSTYPRFLFVFLAFPVVSTGFEADILSKLYLENSLQYFDDTC